MVERVYRKSGFLGPALWSPAEAKTAVRQIAGSEPGIVLTDAQNRPIAFVPVPPSEAMPLRQDSRVDTLYRAISKANAGSAFIPNPNFAYTLDQARNLARLLATLDVRALGVIACDGNQSETVESWAQQGKSFESSTFLSRRGENGRYELDPQTARDLPPAETHAADQRIALARQSFGGEPGSTPLLTAVTVRDATLDSLTANLPGLFGLDAG